MAAGERVDEFGPYRVVRVIGSGGMGLIHEAIDTRLGLRVALKQLHPHVMGRPGAAERFLREGRAAARIRHAHVVQVFTLGTAESGPYLAMELLEGCDLGKTLRERGRLDVEAALELLLPVIAAVAEAHAAGVIHRDLKPSNVFVCRGAGGRPHPKVLDFGVSKVLSDEAAGPVTATDSVLGTFEYMPPEQARAARDASYASDQYSLAVILYQCVTGDLPFSGGGVHDLLQAIMTAPLQSPSQRVAGIPRVLDDILLRAMSRNPRDRFPSVRSFGGALLPLARDRDRLAWIDELSGERDEAVVAVIASAETLEAATPPTMPPTAKDARASALQKRVARRALGALAGSLVVVVGVTAWTARHGRAPSKTPSESTEVAVASVAAEDPVHVAAPTTNPTNGESPASTGQVSASASVVVNVHPRSPARPKPSGAPPAPRTSLPMGDNGAPILP